MCEVDGLEDRIFLSIYLLCILSIVVDAVANGLHSHALIYRCWHKDYYSEQQLRLCVDTIPINI